ncbi:hypothetical protein DL96DRAFT_1751874, partial [Flagelloscypha sp. PMI_526]
RSIYYWEPKQSPQNTGSRQRACVSRFHTFFDFCAVFRRFSSTPLPPHSLAVLEGATRKTAEVQSPNFPSSTLPFECCNFHSMGSDRPLQLPTTKTMTGMRTDLVGRPLVFGDRGIQLFLTSAKQSSYHRDTLFLTRTMFAKTATRGIKEKGDENKRLAIIMDGSPSMSVAPPGPTHAPANELMNQKPLSVLLGLSQSRDSMATDGTDAKMTEEDAVVVNITQRMDIRLVTTVMPRPLPFAEPQDKRIPNPTSSTFSNSLMSPVFPSSLTHPEFEKSSRLQTLTYYARTLFFSDGHFTYTLMISFC